MPRFIPEQNPSSVVSALSQVSDWGQAFCGITDFRRDTGISGRGVRIAILDTGIDTDHPDLEQNIVKVMECSEDDNGHGTFCAGIVAGTDNGIGVVGISPGAGLLVSKVLDGSGLGDWGTISRGLGWALDSGADIISMSFGSPIPPTYELCSLIDEATNRGVILVAASGNEGMQELDYPARMSSVIAVGAIDGSGRVAGFSNISEDLTVLAPGVDNHSTWLGGGYATESGTSFACPYVVGVLALLIEQHRLAGSTASPLVDCSTAIEHIHRVAPNGIIDLTVRVEP